MFLFEVFSGGNEMEAVQTKNNRVSVGNRVRVPVSHSYIRWLWGRSGVVVKDHGWYVQIHLDNSLLSSDGTPVHYCYARSQFLIVETSDAG
jgi:hypothetical protein